MLAQSQRAMQGQAGEIVLHLVLFARWSGRYQASVIRPRSTFPLFGTRLVAHVGSAGEALLITPEAFLDVRQGLLQRLFVNGVGEIQPSGERLVELGARERANLFLEPGHLPLSEARSQVVYHQGYQFAFLGFAVSHLRLLESFRRPSLQRIPGAVVRGDD